MEPMFIAGLILVIGAFGIWVFTVIVGVAIWSYVYSEFVTRLKSMVRVDDKNDRKHEKRLICEDEKRRKRAEKQRRKRQRRTPTSS